QADRQWHLDPTHDGRFDIVELDPKVGDADGGHAAKLRSPISLGQCHGKSSWRRDAGRSAMRANTPASQARGSTSFSFAETISEYTAAGRSPPATEPANSHAFLPRAMPRNARSAALFVKQILPSSRT